MPVLQISGSKMITQQDLQRAADAQQAAALAARIAQKRTLEVEQTIGRGADVEAGDLYFDRKAITVKRHGAKAG